MATLELTSSATTLPIETMDRLQAAERIGKLRSSIQPINDEIAAVIKRLGVLDAEEAQDVERKSVTLENLLSDPSYETDTEFQPSELDTERRQNLENRIEAYSRLTREIRILESDIRDLKNIDSIIERKKETITSLVKELGELFAWGLFSPTRKKFLKGDLQFARQNLKFIEALKPNAPQKISEKSERVITANQELGAIQPDEAYSSDALHRLPAKRLLARTEQSIPVSISGSTVTLRIPRTPGEKDFTQIVQLDYSTDREEFVKVFGETVNVETKKLSSTWMISDVVYYEFDIEDQQVPFPLEVVEIDGEEVCRIPNVVWQKFKQ